MPSSPLLTNNGSASSVIVKGLGWNDVFRYADKHRMASLTPLVCELRLLGSGVDVWSPDTREALPPTGIVLFYAVHLVRKDCNNYTYRSTCKEAWRVVLAATPVFRLLIKICACGEVMNMFAGCNFTFRDTTALLSSSYLRKVMAHIFTS